MPAIRQESDRDPLPSYPDVLDIITICSCISTSDIMYIITNQHHINCTNKSRVNHPRTGIEANIIFAKVTSNDITNKIFLQYLTKKKSYKSYKVGAWNINGSYSSDHPENTI